MKRFFIFAIVNGFYGRHLALGKDQNEAVTRWRDMMDEAHCTSQFKRVEIAP